MDGWMDVRMDVAYILCVCIHVCMDGWVDGWMDVCMDVAYILCVCIHVCMDGWVDGWMDVCMDVHTVWMDGCVCVDGCILRYQAKVGVSS